MSRGSSMKQRYHRNTHSLPASARRSRRPTTTTDARSPPPFGVQPRTEDRNPWRVSLTPVTSNPGHADSALACLHTLLNQDSPSGGRRKLSPELPGTWPYIHHAPTTLAARLGHYDVDKEGLEIKASCLHYPCSVGCSCHEHCFEGLHAGAVPFGYVMQTPLKGCMEVHVFVLQ